MQEQQQHLDSVNAVAIKIPPFWPADPELWFLQVDALFQTRNITAPKTKFNHVVASISPQAAATVRDIIRAPPAGDAYQVLKESLIKRNAPTRHHCLQQLLHQITLGDRKPSELLRRMRQLHGDGTPDTELLRELFLQRLPKEIRAVLSAMAMDTTNTLDNLAETADNMIEATGPSITADDSLLYQTPGQVNEIEQLRQEVATLRRAKYYKQPATPSTNGFCWYHTRFGNRARSCAQPCTFSGNDKAGR